MKTRQEIQAQLEILEQSEGLAPLRLLSYEGNKVFSQIGSDGQPTGKLAAYIVRWYRNRHPKKAARCRQRCGLDEIPPVWPMEGVIRHSCGCAVAVIIITASTKNVAPLFRAAVMLLSAPQ